MTRKNSNSLREMQKIRTQKKRTKTWVTAWTTWAEEKGYSPNIVSYEAEEIYERLHKFFAAVRKKHGSD